MQNVLRRFRIGSILGSWIKNNMANHIKQFCLRGHDTSICGRTTDRACKECRRFIDRQTRINNIREPKQFCVHGHDTFKTGRYETGHCKVCTDKKNRRYETIKRKTDINFRLACNLRNRIRGVIKGNQKPGSSVKDLGCTIEFFKQYIENKFYSDMTWDNWGLLWEIDHIEELHTFDLTIRSEFLRACHYTNLQPLTIKDHQKKTIKNRS